MEKIYAECLHAPDNEGFPISVNESSSSPTTQSGEVTCLISESGLAQSYLTGNNGDPLCGEEAYIIEENPLRCMHIIIS